MSSTTPTPRTAPKPSSGSSPGCAPSIRTCAWTSSGSSPKASHLDLDPGNPENPGRALADYFRLENGKVVEHWDVIQDVPTKAANDNGMF
ncbi:hypothetical protein ACIA9I_34685 [Streptomyces anulatus]